MADSTHNGGASQGIEAKDFNERVKRMLAAKPEPVGKPQKRGGASFTKRPGRA